MGRFPMDDALNQPFDPAQPDQVITENPTDLAESEGEALEDEPQK